MRTTLDLDKPVLEGLRALQRKEKRSMSRIASELLADALNARRKAGQTRSVSLPWNSSAMGARVDLLDKESVYRILDERPK
ncbi:MAG TPA: antitoxin [Terriglobia bacterium]|nr:antitoxin [Terriglobia bacterium]